MVPIITFLKKLPQSLRTGLLGVTLTALSFGGAFAQTDTEFWFVVPDITFGHNSPGGVPASLKFSSSNFAATVTISMPAGDPAIFPDIVVELAPYDFQVVSLDAWIVSGGADVNPTLLENKALTPDGINNFGLHITSTAPITAYYEVNNYNNKDIWALKGRNGLGTEFFTPFQNQANNGTYTPQPISAIDIVATEDGTDVTFTLPPGKGASYGTGPETDIAATPAGNVFTVTLDRGQTFSLFPLNRSTAAADRLAGTKIESSNPIAVTLKDDSHTHLSYGCRDVSGDQLIPTKVWDKNTSTFMDLIGREYIAIRTGLYDQDNLFILPVEDNTNIRVYNPAGAEVANVTRNARQQYFQPLLDGNAYYHIVADKPVYVMHIGGFGCEVGAAILPPIEKCTGVPRVAFARTSTEDFYIVIMVRKGAEDGFEFDGVERDDIFPPGSFIPVPNSEWSVARFGPISQANAAVGTHFMRNTKDIFHLGIVNGGAGTGCFYGYFSDYNEFNPETLVIETGSEGGRICSGQTLSLYASGGTKYEWSPATYLDDPTSETPTAYNIESSINYTVTISGACNTFAIRHVNLQVGGPVTASFDSDFYTACATPPPLGGTPRYTFNFTSTSTGDAKRWWSWQLGETGTSNQFKYGDNSTADDARSAILTLENNTDQILEYHVKLRTSDDQEFCFQEVTKIIRVYPYIDISAARTIVSDPNCQPLTVDLTGTPSGNFNGATYKWNFGDGNSAPTQNATNIYNNTAPPYNSIDYFPEVTITDKWNVCTATDNVLVTVPPYLEASFTANPVSGCSPLQVNNFSNTSKGVPADGFTWKLYRLGSPDVEVGSSITGSPPDISSASTLLVNNRTDNLEEVYRLDLEVTNASGCLKTYSQEFTVYPNPTATVSIDDPGAPDINCSPLQIDLSASTIRNTNSFQWLVDGVSRLSNPDPIGSPPANYTGSLTLENFSNAPIPKVVSYKATNSWGCEYVAPPLNVNVQPHIHSEIVLDPEVICPDSETGLFDVQILDAKIVADGQYEWFVEGVSQGVNTDIGTRTFDYNTLTKNANGEAFINLQLVVENAAGCIKTDNQQIKVNPQVSVDFDAYIGASLINPGAGGTGTTLCPPETLDFTSSTTYANSYQWKFGGLKEATTQNASLDVENNGSSAFDLPVTLTASNSYGCSGTVTKTYTIEPEVITNFDIESLAGCAPFTLDVSAVDNGTTYNWEFVGKNRTGADQVFDPVENKTGVSLYETITLEAVRGNCTLVKNDVVVTIYPEVQARWTGDLTERCAPADINLTNNSNLFAPASPSVTNIQWRVFDGATLVTSSSAQSFTPSLPNTSHTAQKAYDVHLTATSADGCVGEHDETITVNPNPLARFEVDITDNCTPTVINVTNNSVTTGADPYNWNWDTNGVATDENASSIEVTYTNSTESVEGKWIELEVTNQYGCKDFYDYTFEVYPELDPIYDIPPAVCSGLTGATLEFNKNASSSGGGINDVSLQWDFGDGNTRTTGFVDQVTKDFTNLSDADFTTSTKIFATQLATGCTANREVNVIVHPKVESIFTFEIGDVCNYPLPVTFTNAAKYSKQAGVTTQFHWDYGYGGEEDTFNASSPLTHTHAFTNANPNQIVEYDVVFSITQTHPSGRTCANTSTRKIQVYPEMLPSFNLPTTEGCNPLTVNFENNSTGVNLDKVDGTPWNGQFVWDLGNGSTSSSITPATREYGHADKTQSHIYNISLTATNPLGCVKTATTSTPQVTVYPWVESSFAVDKIEGCTPLNVTLNNTSVSSTYTYQWNFTENGSTVSTPTTSTAAQPGVITFTNPLGAGDELSIQNPVIDLVTSLNTSVYTVGGGCTKSSTQTVSVFPHVYPSFDATLEGCHPLNINFTNTSNVFGGTGNGKYTWDLGIGVTTNNQSPTQEYQNSSLVANQSYTGRLTSVSEHGCTDFIPFTVTVWPKPQALIELTEYMECSPFNLEIINQSIGKNRGSTLEFTYDYGDGSPPVGPTTNDGNLPHEFSNFNDYIESYTMSLYVKTEDGCDDITHQTIQVFPEVTSIFDTDDGNHALCNPFEVDFVNNSRNAWRYYWDFDDGGITSSSFAPSYRFVNNGTVDRVFDVSLTVMSEYDCEHTEILPLTVYAAPIADFAIIPPHQVFPQNGTLPTFEFRNQSRPGGMPASWAHSWTFGDGNTSTSMDQSLSHTYEHWGFRDDDFRYEVTLSIENERCSDFVAQKLTLLPPEPISIFRADNYRSCSPLVIKFFNDSKFYLTESEATAFEWRLNNADEPFSTEFEPTLTITEPGYYNIGLRVYGDGGEKNYYRTFRVFENPVARFEVMPERVLLPNAKVHFFNLSENANKYVWDFGDGTPKSSEKDPVHIYDELGEYRVSLMAFAEYEHKDDDGNLLIHECIDYDSRFPAVWVEGEGKILFPNAFMPSKLGPNGGYYDEVDYKNEVFHPVADGVIEYRLMIFNRWGEQIFESNDIKIGWDGYYKGKLASQDVYVWRAVGKFSNGELFDVRGNVTLLR